MTRTMTFLIAWLSFVVGSFVVHPSMAQQQSTQLPLMNEVAIESWNVTETFANDTDGTSRNEIDRWNVSSIFVLAPRNETENATQTPSESPSTAPSDYPTIVSNAEYYDMPKLKWAHKLEGTGLFRPEGKLAKGNSVRSSPDGLLVYVTKDNGGLSVISAHDGNPRWSYTPEPLSTGWSVACHSGVYFGKFGNGDQYLVFAVIDIPPRNDTQDYSSRIFAVSHPTNKILWKSESVPGTIQGSPIITQVNPGLYVFFNHNQRNLTSGELVGSFSMINGVDGKMMFTEIAGESRVDPGPDTWSRISSLRLPYTALGVAHQPEWGRYPGGKDNIRDFFIWSTSDMEGRGEHGYTRGFQLPKLFDPRFAPAMHTTFLRETRWNAIAAPALTKDGMGVVFGVGQNEARGWTGDDDFDKVANVEQSLGTDPKDDLLPIPFSPVFSQSERFVLLTSTTSKLSLLRTETGEVVWTVSFDSPLSAKPVVSRDDQYIYVTRANGFVSALKMASGEEVWELSCADIQDTSIVSESVSRSISTCVDLIDAESSISPNGLVFFYGDKFGNVKALQLGLSTIPTSAPSEIPTFPITSSPSIAPSDSPSQTPFPTDGPTTTPFPTEKSFVRPTFAPIDWAELMNGNIGASAAASGRRESWISMTTTTIMAVMTLSFNVFWALV
ncbi:PQQ-like domain containing protein [Nitzschia inconspicua]|uniref:PQQ-like domain containing protein n=1 Tax=Nitzschia inconspicua TaxID=303405 RepID=A0A9K3L4F8_9STRA|nr:PQQ-like domain containing protein [Nitzschia inconspicua]